MKKSLGFLFLFIFVVVLSFTSTKEVVVNAEETKSEIETVVEAMQPGWNLGNTFEATPGETSWGNPTTTKALIDHIAEQGFKSIRIPIRWDRRIGAAPDYTIDPVFLSRIKEVVDWSTDAGLYVMINMHHEEWIINNMESNRATVLERYEKAWTQIAEYFKDYPNTLIFEGINEPRFSSDWNKDMPIYFEMLEDLNTTFHRVVRDSGSNNTTRPLVLTTVTGATTKERLDELYQTIVDLDDENIIATVHYYGFWPFSVNIAGKTTFDSEVKNDITTTFDRIYNTFVAKGIPVILGEYGLLGFDSSLNTIQHGEMLKYFEYLTYYAKLKGITHMLWDNGQHLNRRTLNWVDNDLYNVIFNSVTSRSSSTVSDSVYLKKDEAITDVTLKLNLNGNGLVEVSLDGETLQSGTDYILNQDSIVLKSSLLSTLVTDDLGTNAILTLKFSAGADWKVRIIYYDTPILRSINGTTANFSIPTVFNGDKLATMSAKYKSGSVAGPQNWTEYKEFDRTFKPDYSTNQIKLTQDFFKEVNDSEVILKMYFWSGEIVEYHITKSNGKITGVSNNEPQEPQEPEEPVDEEPNDETPTPETPEDSKKDDNTIKYIVSGIAIIGVISLGAVFLVKRKGF